MTNRRNRRANGTKELGHTVAAQDRAHKSAQHVDERVS